MSVIMPMLLTPSKLIYTPRHCTKGAFHYYRTFCYSNSNKLQLVSLVRLVIIIDIDTNNRAIMLAVLSLNLIIFLTLLGAIEGNYRIL